MEMLDLPEEFMTGTPVKPMWLDDGSPSVGLVNPASLDEEPFVSATKKQIQPDHPGARLSCSIDALKGDRCKDHSWDEPDPPTASLDHIRVEPLP
eukprot:3623701-Amphidinium_carterae.1